jgi:ketosteroid isomerase-like protein
VSQENVEVVGRSLDAWRRGDVEASLAYVHPEARLDVSSRPDGKVWVGRDGVRQGMDEWVSTWEQWRFEVERYIDAGDDRVVVLWHESGHAKGSGIAMSEAGVTVTTILNGMIISSVLSLDRKRVLADLGLE